MIKKSFSWYASYNYKNLENGLIIFYEVLHQVFHRIRQTFFRLFYDFIKTTLAGFEPTLQMETA